MIKDKKIVAATDAAKEFCSNALKEVQKRLVTDEDSNYDFKIMTRNRKDLYEYLFNHVSEVKEELRTANTEQSVNKALDKLTTHMDMLANVSYADVKAWSVELTEVLNMVKLHTLTLSSFDQILENALSRIEKIIAVEEEKENDNVAKLTALFLELAEHSEAIAKIIDVNKIFDFK